MRWRKDSGAQEEPETPAADEESVDDIVDRLLNQTLGARPNDPPAGKATPVVEPLPPIEARVQPVAEEPPPPDDPPSAPAQQGGDGSLTKSSALMATGTIASRITGFGRDLVMVWAIGTAVFADAYNVANTVPNVIYILVAGGVLNAVFVPQLVKSMRNDADGGKAYADRLVTAIGMVLLVLTVAAVLAAPLVISAYAWTFRQSDSAADFDVAVTFARYFLPQIFFYGLHVMLGQVLNARGRFGPMMFTPILNNLVVIATGILFISATSDRDVLDSSNVTAGEVRLLAIGTTLGVVVQALALLPMLRRSGYSYRPRFDLRGHGLGRAYRLAFWTLLFVLINQIAYLAVVQFATAAGQNAVDDGIAGRGYTPYTKAYLIMLLPHAVITVSVVTALLPRMSRAVADGRLADLREDLGSGLRLTGALLVPGAVALGVLGPSLTVLALGYGKTSVADAQFIGFVLSAFALGLVPFSVHHQLLRAFYAFEDTRTPVTINVWIAAVNISLAAGCAQVLPARWVVVGLAASYSISYLVGVGLCARKLAKRVGPMPGEVLRTYDRLILAAAIAAVPALILSEVGFEVWGPGQSGSLFAVVAGGLSLVVVYVVAAAKLGIGEVTEVIGTVRRKVGR
ncbi:MAG: murein biosynthesis integral membrane protein MurJ [Sporichthyaceae bacterium]